MKKDVKQFLNYVLTLTSSEMSFTHQFASGYYEPDLLFESPEILERINKHPMALWKCNKT